MDPVSADQYIREKINMVNSLPIPEPDRSPSDDELSLWQIVKSVALEVIKGVGIILGTISLSMLAVTATVGVGFLALSTMNPIPGLLLYFGTGFVLTGLAGGIGKVAADAWIKDS